MSYIRISSVDSSDSNSTATTMKGSVAQIGPLSNIRFAVFALGSSAYPNFCAFGRYLDNMLADLGGERIMKLTTGDELCGQEQAFNEWSQKLFQEAGEVFCFSDEVNLNEVLQNASLNRASWSQEDIRLMPVNNRKSNIHKGLIGNTNRKLFKLSLDAADLLYDDTADSRKTIRVTLNVTDVASDFEYLPGDHLGIYPENDESQVSAIINRIHGDHIDVDGHYCLQMRQIRHLGLKEIEDWIPHERFVCITPRQALLHCIDIMSPPTQQFLALLADTATDDDEKNEIISLATDGKKYENWKAYHLPSLVDVLNFFPSLSPSWPFILTQMPPLQPRYYSISSSPLFNEHVKSLVYKNNDMNPTATDVDVVHLNGNGSVSSSDNGFDSDNCSLDVDTCHPESRNILTHQCKGMKDCKCNTCSSHLTTATAGGGSSSSISGNSTCSASSYSPIQLTVAVVTFRTPSGADRAGVCSQFLYQSGINRPGHCVYSFIRSAPNFRMPDKDDLPIIMVGPGTGIAPFRSFWLHRFANHTIQPHKKFGPMSLFFGCRTPQVQLYRDEVELMKENGVLTHLAVAYSRHPSQPKVSTSSSLHLSHPLSLSSMRVCVNQLISLTFSFSCTFTEIRARLPRAKLENRLQSSHRTQRPLLCVR